MKRFREPSSGDAECAVPPVAPLKHCPKSQAKIVNHASVQNPMPTAVPAPQKQFFGTLGVRHVICMVGLPHRGRNYVAAELGWYLEFFHGTEVKIFDVAAYADASGEASSRGKCAHDLLAAVDAFLEGSTAATEEGHDADAGRVAIILPFRMSDSERDQRLLERSKNALQHVWSGLIYVARMCGEQKAMIVLTCFWGGSCKTCCS